MTRLSKAADAFDIVRRDASQASELLGLSGRIAVDLDGTWDQDVPDFNALARRCDVVVLTGNVNADAKLKSIGATGYSNVVILPAGDPVQHANDKATWCKQHGITALVDDSPQNCTAARAVGLHCLQWKATQ